MEFYSTQHPVGTEGTVISGYNHYHDPQGTEIRYWIAFGEYVPQEPREQALEGGWEDLWVGWDKVIFRRHKPVKCWPSCEFGFW